LKNQKQDNLTAQGNEEINSQKRWGKLLSFLCACYSKNFMCVLVITIEIPDNLNTKFLEISPKTIAGKLFILRGHLRKDSYRTYNAEKRENKVRNAEYGRNSLENIEAHGGGI